MKASEYAQVYQRRRQAAEWYELDSMVVREWVLFGEAFVEVRESGNIYTQPTTAKVAAIAGTAGFLIGFGLATLALVFGT